MGRNFNINDFSEHLFWDTDRGGLDLEEHAAYIVKNVLMFGTYEDWIKLVKIYGIEHIARIVMKTGGIDKKSASFVSLVSGVPLEKFKCYSTGQSSQKHWDY